LSECAFRARDRYYRSVCGGDIKPIESQSGAGAPDQRAWTNEADRKLQRLRA